MRPLIPTIVLLAPLLGTSSQALAAGAEPLCHPDEERCLVAEATVDPSRLLCARRPPDYDPGREYRDEVREEAERWGKVFGVPRAWIASQAFAESRNRPLAANPSGATGVMQVKLARARDLARWIERSAYWANREVRGVVSRLWGGARADLRHLELNVMLAAYDIRRLADKFGRDHAVVAAAYNQGEGKIARCLAGGRGVPPRGAEYVRRVMRAKQAGYV